MEHVDETTLNACEAKYLNEKGKTKNLDTRCSAAVMIGAASSSRKVKPLLDKGIQLYQQKIGSKDKLFKRCEKSICEGVDFCSKHNSMFDKKSKSLHIWTDILKDGTPFSVGTSIQITNKIFVFSKEQLPIFEELRNYMINGSESSEDESSDLSEEESIEEESSVEVNSIVIEEKPVVKSKPKPKAKAKAKPKAKPVIESSEESSTESSDEDEIEEVKEVKDIDDSSVSLS